MIIPTVFTETKEQYELRLQRVLPLANRIHIDFMDGEFVPKRSTEIQDIQKLDFENKTFEAHLMVADPVAWLPLLADKGFSHVLYHVESLPDEAYGRHLIEDCKSLGMEPIPGKNAATPLADLLLYANDVSTLLFMGIEAGAEGRPFNEVILDQIRQTKVQFPNIKIEIDGAVNDTTTAVLAHAGADFLCAGSFVNKADNAQSAFDTLVHLFDEGKQS